MHIRYLILAPLAVPVLALGVEVASAPSTTTLVINSDLILLLKVAIWLGGIFLAILATLGLTFFGWDVRNARASMIAIQRETKELQQDAVELLNTLKEESEKVKTEIDKLEQLGAQLEEESDLHVDSQQSDSESPISPPNASSDSGTSAEHVETAGRSTTPDASSPEHSVPEHSAATWLHDPKSPISLWSTPYSRPRTNIDLIRDVIRDSKYEWTTIGRIMNKTTLSRDQVLEEIRKASDIKIGRGRQTGDFIFKSSVPHS
ncbi:hypothetical protein AB4Y32_29625 [Paraburkholderia phymatum]|uniref:Uncharacterized protein n=1 Tax=Paraburkholderia phymatum TaxID=148447 RepID=A0ACC6U8F8_9BURK